MKPLNPNQLPDWLKLAYFEIIQPKREIIQNHEFVQKMKLGEARKEDAKHYFAGLMWHLLDFGKHVSHLIQKRPDEVDHFLKDRSEDTDGDTELLSRIVDALGEDSNQICGSPWTYQPHPVWIQHDALLRSAIYSTDFSWKTGTAALTIGIESLVPSMIEPLFQACIENYGVASHQAEWLESRSGDEEKQHGENGFLILERFVDLNDQPQIDQCLFFIKALSDSMAHRLLESGLPQSPKNKAQVP